MKNQFIHNNFINTKIEFKIRTRSDSGNIVTSILKGSQDTTFEIKFTNGIVSANFFDVKTNPQSYQINDNREHTVVVEVEKLVGGKFELRCTVDNQDPDTVRLNYGGPSVNDRYDHYIGSVPGENQTNNFAGCLTEFKLNQFIKNPMSAEMKDLHKLVSAMSAGAKCTSSCTFT